jgi:hypothetical protein
LSELQYAAKLADVDQETLSGSLEKLQLRLAEVAMEGSGPAALALRRFGLSASSLAAQGPVEAFTQLATIMEGIESPAERAKVAFDLFGKSGQGMLNIIAQGKDGLAGLRQEAADLGNKFTAIDTAKIDEADDAMTRVGLAVSGVGNQLAVKLAPFLTYTADLMVDFMKEGIKAGSFVSQAMDWVTTGLGWAVDGVTLLKTGFHGLKAVVAEGVSYFLAGFDKVLAGIDYVVEKLSGERSSLSGALTEWSKGFDVAAHEEIKSAVDAFQHFGEGHATVRKFVNDIQVGADQRATLAAGQANKFGAPSAVSMEAHQGPKFAGAADLGSKEAYSSIVRNRYSGQGSTEARTTANATTRTAAAVERSNALLQAIAAGAQNAMGVKPHMPGAT